MAGLLSEPALDPSPLAASPSAMTFDPSSLGTSLADDPFPEPDASSVDALSALDAREALEAEAARRSFLAQPEPLKWMVGGVNAFLTGPLPHRAQTAGPSSWIPRMTSKRRPQAAQS